MLGTVRSSRGRNILQINMWKNTLYFKSRNKYVKEIGIDFFTVSFSHTSKVWILVYSIKNMALGPESLVFII